MPDEIELWSKRSDGMVVLPRGAMNYFGILLRSVGYEINWTNDTTLRPFSEHLFRDVAPINLRDYQIRARDAIVDSISGIYMAPTGTGKTSVVLDAIRYLGQRSIVIVERTSLAEQWRRRCTDELGIEPGIIGYGKWEDQGPITIALRQSLWAKLDETSEGFYRSFGFVCVDECHHTGSAETLIDLIQNFYAYYRIGVSATPDKNDDTFQVAKAVLGPIFHTTTPREVGDKIIKPIVRVINTDFEFDYQSTQKVDGPKGRPVIQRNNYTSMMAALCTDERRNQLIVDLVVKETREDHSCLVVSRRKGHLDILWTMLQNEFVLLGELPPLFMLTGEQKDHEAADIAERINVENRAVLLSTVADEGLDIPRLDRVFLAYPQRKVYLVKQQIGRIGRTHPDKKDAIVFDFVDTRIDLIKGQARERMQRLYHLDGYDVVRPEEARK